jgi:transposase
VREPGTAAESCGIHESIARVIPILDNLNTHKPKRDRWLQRHPQVHLHFTPTYSSSLNQAECWFSILSRSALRGASFTSARQLR